MKKALANLIGKKFSVYVSGEFERMTDFLGFLKLLVSFSDFFAYRKSEQKSYLEKVAKEKYGYIDANIFVKLGKSDKVEK